jgi:hypothetical protein
LHCPRSSDRISGELSWRQWLHLRLIGAVHRSVKVVPESNGS